MQQRLVAAGQRWLHTSSVSVGLSPAYVIWGSNTDVGKTLLGAAIAHAAVQANVPLLYLKPLQTGFPTDCDGRLVGNVTQQGNTYGPHAASLLTGGVPNPAAPVKTLFAWSRAVSPHLAVLDEGRSVSASDIVAAVRHELSSHAQRHAHGLALIETAGGVASPTADGTLQCDLYAALRMDGILVGDGRLGGISATLAAMDALLLRGHTVPLVLLTEDGALDNSCALQRYVDDGTRVVALPPCPPAQPGAQGSSNPAIDASLEEWLTRTADARADVLAHLMHCHSARVQRLATAAECGLQQLWWPFTQHQGIQPSDVTVMEGRWGEFFQTVPSGGNVHTGNVDTQMGTLPEHALPQGSVVPMYDACGSWWTQGGGAQAHAHLARQVGFAAGRYLHMMLPENVNPPVLDVAARLLEGPGSPWASKVFLSDNGSTAVEVALKMAFRTFLTASGLLDRNQPPPHGQGPTLHVLALMSSYHGDTLGSMDCAAPSVFNGILEAPWYRGRGLFLDPPTVALVQGAWQVHAPAGVLGATAVTQAMDSRDALFAYEARSASAASYQSFITRAMDEHQAASRALIGALIMEPLLQGAGGMIMLDPLFQRVLAATCRARGVPVIYDEVFVGCWRLGVPSAGSLLGVEPDIACYGKLLTGGAMPLAATVVQQHVYDVFLGPRKVHALLHGHSFSGNPIACHAAATALAMYADPARNPNLCSPDNESWDQADARALSRVPGVARVVVLGSVLAVELEPEAGQGSGYDSTRTQRVVARLAAAGVYARPLGTVVYLMCTPLSEGDVRMWLQRVFTCAVSGK